MSKSSEPSGKEVGESAEGHPAEEPESETGVFRIEDIDVEEASPFHFMGVVDLTYVRFESKDQVSGLEEEDLFPLHPMAMFAYHFRDILSAHLELEWEGVDRFFEIERVFLRWHAWDELIELDVGRRDTPFGIFRFYHSPRTNTLVDIPGVYRAVYPEVYPDYGVFLSGQKNTPDWAVGYEIGVVYGLQGPLEGGVWGDLTDNNDSKSFAGRLSYSPVEGLVFGASYYGGNYDKNDSLWADYTGFDVQHRVAGIILRAEWLGGIVERQSNDGGNYYRHGWYVQVERNWPLPWRYLIGLETAFRYGDVDPNNRVRDTLDHRQYAFGINLRFHEQLRWKFQYEINDERYKEIANDGFLTQIEFHW